MAMKRSLLAIFLTVALLFSSCAVAAGYSTLKRGSSGSAVVELQTALKELGYYSYSIDGKFGSGTENAVKRFQKDHGLSQDGKAGNITLSLLYSITGTGSEEGSSQQSAGSSVSSKATTSLASLKKGSSGSEVITLQTQLKALNYYQSAIDGKFGSGTEKAVIAFQKAYGLTADGIAGTKTRTKLQSVYDSTQGTTSSGGTVVPLDPNTLAAGSTGERVTTLQTQLKALGFYTIKIDGKFGSGTQAAVIAFQAANGLTADGLAGSKTLSAIEKKYNALIGSSSGSGDTSGIVSENNQSAGTSSSGSLSRTLRRNSSGEDVKMVQRRLKELGYYGGEIDGSYGSSTIASVTAFQFANGLSVDGNCGTATWAVLSSSSALVCSSKASVTNTSIKASNGATVRLLHWNNDVKNSLSNGDYLTVYDPETGITWTLRVFSRGRHCDCEPLTAEDTANMNRAFGNVTTWNPKPVYVKLPDGRWTLASTHNTPHESQSIKNNNFDGHLCVHFLRDMTEAVQNDSNYGVQNQNTIRIKWKDLTGETIR